MQSGEEIEASATDGAAAAADAPAALTAAPTGVAVYMSAAALTAPELIDAGEEDEDHDAASAPDASSDETWMNDSSGDSDASSNEASSQHTSGGRSGGTVAAGTGDAEFRDEAARIVNTDACQEQCLQGKQGALENVSTSLSRMSKGERRASLMTALAILNETGTAVRHRGQGLRDRFNYFLPFLGRVCSQTFAACFGVSGSTITRSRNVIRHGSFSPPKHGGHRDTNAVAVE